MRRTLKEAEVAGVDDKLSDGLKRYFSRAAKHGADVKPVSG